MHLNKLLSALAAGVLTLVLASNALAQAAPPQKSSPSGQKDAQEYSLKGKIAYQPGEGGYFIQRHDNSREVYIIANQNPEVLAPLAQSGRIVTIEGSNMGDILTIHKIDGQPYTGKQKPVFK
jgi:hypothetical protein